MTRSGREQAGILILRAWVEDRRPAALRVRITSAIDGDEVPVVTATTVVAVLDVVQAWLEGLVDAYNASASPTRHDR